MARATNVMTVDVKEISSQVTRGEITAPGNVKEPADAASTHWFAVWLGSKKKAEEEPAACVRTALFLLVYNPARQPTRRAASQQSPLRRTFAGRLASSSHRATLIEKLRVRRHHVSRASGERQHPVDWGATLWRTLGYRNARTSHRSDTTERTDRSGGHARCWSPMGEARRSAAMITLEA